MLKISDFSRLTRVPAKTLRYYDDLGLLKPAHVDPWTGWSSFRASTASSR
jgi:DNA-binding transcriptional MerR regulator